MFFSLLWFSGLLNYCLQYFGAILFMISALYFRRSDLDPYVTQPTIQIPDKKCLSSGFFLFFFFPSGQCFHCSFIGSSVTLLQNVSYCFDMLPISKCLPNYKFLCYFSDQQIGRPGSKGSRQSHISGKIKNKLSNLYNCQTGQIKNSQSLSLFQ